MSTRFGSAVPRSGILGLSMLGLLLLPACSTFESDKDAAPPPPPYMPVEFAMPAGSTIDRGDTIVVGDNLNWYGTLAITSDSGMDEAHQFYSSELPREGWEPVSALMANRVVLQFINHHQNRASIVTIEPRTIGGSHIEIIVAPLLAHSQTADERASERMSERSLPPPPRSER
jgi:hypothetical protein